MTTLLLILMSTMLVNVFVLAGTPQARGSKDHQGRWGKEVGVAVFGALMLLGAAVGGYAFEYAILKPTHFEYLRTLSLVGLIAALTPAARALVGKIMPNSVIASVRFIEALTSNAASLGVALFSALHAASWGAA